MKKICLIVVLNFWLLPMSAGIVKTVTGAACLFGGVVSGNMAHEAYKEEDKRIQLLNTNSSKVIKPVKEKALALAESLENPENKWLLRPINWAGNHLEEAERKYPQTSKCALTAVGFFCLAIVLIK